MSTAKLYILKFKKRMNLYIMYVQCTWCHNNQYGLQATIYNSVKTPLLTLLILRTFKAYVSEEILNWHSLSLSPNADLCIIFID